MTRMPRILFLVLLLVSMVGCSDSTAEMQMTCDQDAPDGTATTFLLSDYSAFQFDDGWYITHVISKGGAAKVNDGDGISVTLISPVEVELLIEQREERELDRLALQVVGSEWGWQQIAREQYSFGCGKVVQTDYDEVDGEAQFSVFELALGNDQSAIATALFHRGNRSERLEAVRDIVASFKPNKGPLTADHLTPAMFLGAIERFIYRTEGLTFAAPSPVEFTRRDDGTLLLAETAEALSKVSQEGEVIEPIAGHTIAYLWTLSAAEAQTLVRELPPAKVEALMRSNCVLSCRYFVELAQQFAKSPAPLHPAIVALGVAREIGFGYDKELEWTSNCVSCKGIKLNVEQEGAIWAEALADGDYAILVHFGAFHPQSDFRESLTWILDSTSTTAVPDFRRRELQEMGLPISLPEGTVRVGSVKLDQQHLIEDLADPGPAWSFRYPAGRQWQVKDEPLVDVIPGLPSFGGALPVVVVNTRNEASLGIYGPQDALGGSIGMTMLAFLGSSGFVEEVQHFEYENALVTVFQMTHSTEGRTGAIAITDVGAMVIVSEEDEKAIGIETVAAVAATVQPQ